MPALSRTKVILLLFIIPNNFVHFSPIIITFKKFIISYTLFLKYFVLTNQLDVGNGAITSIRTVHLIYVLLSSQ